MNCYKEDFLFLYLCGYRKGFSVHQFLISRIKKWKTNLDKKGYGGAILMDFPKVVGTINPEFLLAKLHAYGFNKDAHKTIHNYLKNRYQRTKIKKAFSTWSKILLGVPQSSVLGPALPNVYLNYLKYLAEKLIFVILAFHACDSS